MRNSNHWTCLKSTKLKLKINRIEILKDVRSDRDGEYYSRYNGLGRCLGLFANLLKECGIIAQCIMPGTPHQNGIAEIRNRTLKDMIRSMIAQTILPESS